MPTRIIGMENRRQAQPGQTKNYVDREHSRVVTICLCGRNKTRTTGGKSFHPTQQWMEPDEDDSPSSRLVAVSTQRRDGDT